MKVVLAVVTLVILVVRILVGKDQEKSKERAELSKRIVDAISEEDKESRISSINAIIDDVRRL